MSAVTETGRATPMRGAGRPAFSAASRMTGEMCDAMVRIPVIQVTVPSATRPASLSMVSPKAATSTGGAAAPRNSRGAKAWVVMRSPVHVDLLAAEQRHESGQVLLHVAGRLVETEAPHPLHHHLVREADAQNQAVAGGPLHGEGLLGQHHRVAGVDRHHAGAQTDAGHLRPGGGQEGQRVGSEDLDGQGVVEPGFGETPQLGHGVGQRPVDVDQAADAQGFGHGLSGLLA